MKTALIIGKFYPPHMGHKFLIDFAASYPGVDYVYVGVYGLPSEKISVYDRVRWLSEEFAYNPKIKIVGRNEVMPQEPSEHPDFWKLWTDLITMSTGQYHFDYVFASESYGEPLAKCFAAKFIPVDIQRKSTFELSATKVRSNLWHNFNNLIPAARPDFVKTVCLFGAESVGKTTMARQLADDLGTVWVQEYARPYLEFVGEDVTPEKIMDIMRGQMAMEDALRRQSNFVMVKDTDLFMTVMWSLKLLGPQAYDRALLDHARSRKADLYLVPTENIPFEADPLRYGDGVRQMTTQEVVNFLRAERLNFKVITAEDRDQRIIDAQNLIYEELNDKL